MAATEAYELIGFGDMYGPKRYKFIGFRWAFISLMLRNGASGR
jgi:hypothetical protein